LRSLAFSIKHSKTAVISSNIIPTNDYRSVQFAVPQIHKHRVIIHPPRSEAGFPRASNESWKKVEERQEKIKLS
jgi:hypothetical protein